MSIVAQSFEQLMDAFSASLEGSTVSDMNLGSVLRQMNQAFASALAEAWRTLAEADQNSNLATASGDNLKAMVRTFGMEPKAGSPASGSILAIPNNPGNVGSVSSGDLFVYNNLVVFVAGAPIALAAPYSVIPVIAGSFGTKWNLPAGTSLIPTRTDLNSNFTFEVGTGLDASSLPVGGLSDGEDPETDDQIRSRFADYLQSLVRGTFTAVLQAILGVSGVISVTLVEYVPMIGFMTAYIDDGSSNTTLDSTLSSTISTLLNDWRGGGIVVKLKALQKTIVAVTVSIRLDKTIQLVAADVESAVQAAIIAAMDKLNVGQVLYPSMVADAAFKVPGVIDAQVTLPTTFITPGVQQTIRPGTITVNVSL